jgi:hypothetical protein
LGELAHLIGGIDCFASEVSHCINRLRGNGAGENCKCNRRSLGDFLKGNQVRLRLSESFVASIYTVDDYLDYVGRKTTFVLIALSCRAHPPLIRLRGFGS